MSNYILLLKQNDLAHIILIDHVPNSFQGFFSESFEVVETIQVKTQHHLNNFAVEWSTKWKLIDSNYPNILFIAGDCSV